MAAAVRHLFLCDAMYEVIDQIMSRAGMPSTIPAAYCVMGKRVVDSQIRDIGGGGVSKSSCRPIVLSFWPVVRGWM